MASSSGISCFQCEISSSLNFRNGWRLRSGEFAQLCHLCASVYEEGRFCETFHSKDDGWRDCESCGKLIHCGCIASFSTYLLLDFGGVMCMECSKASFILARKRCLSSDTRIQLGEHQCYSRGQALIEPQYWPRVTDLELQEISKNSDSTVMPLFEKLLSASDADPRLGRIVIPKKCAETFFPNIPEPHGLLIKVLDTEAREWEFQYRYWSNSSSKMYILEGLRDLMLLKEWKAGDVVTFYQLEPEKTMVMGLRKSSVLRG